MSGGRWVKLSGGALRATPPTAPTNNSLHPNTWRLGHLKALLTLAYRTVKYIFVSFNVIKDQFHQFPIKSHTVICWVIISRVKIAGINMIIWHICFYPRLLKLKYVVIWQIVQCTQSIREFFSALWNQAFVSRFLQFTLFKTFYGNSIERKLNCLNFLMSTYLLIL